MHKNPEECLAFLVEEHLILHYLDMLLLFCPGYKLRFRIKQEGNTRHMMSEKQTFQMAFI
jgi:hypothetical protein